MLLAMPKSAILTDPSAATSTFPGLTSRWTMPAAWAAPSAPSTWTAMARTSSGGSGPAAMRSARVWPGSRSMTMNGTPSCSPVSKTATAWGWVRVAAALASASKRVRMSARAAMLSCRSLMATGRSRRRSMPA